MITGLREIEMLNIKAIFICRNLTKKSLGHISESMKSDQHRIDLLIYYCGIPSNCINLTIEKRIVGRFYSLSHVRFYSPEIIKMHEEVEDIIIENASKTSRTLITSECYSSLTETFIDSVVNMFGMDITIIPE